MCNISIISVSLFITSGIIFAIAIFVFTMAISCKQSSSEINEEKLILLNEVMIIHTSLLQMYNISIPFSA